MPIICTWNPGTPLGDLSGGNPGGPVSYEIEGTLAQRTGENLIEAIADEVGLDPAAIAIVNGTEVHVEGVWRLTLADSTNGLDRPANDGFGRHVRWLLRNWPGDRRTLLVMLGKMEARYARHALGMTRAQYLTAKGRQYDAVVTADADD